MVNKVILKIKQLSKSLIFVVALTLITALIFMTIFIPNKDTENKHQAKEAVKPHFAIKTASPYTKLVIEKIYQNFNSVIGWGNGEELRELKAKGTLEYAIQPEKADYILKSLGEFSEQVEEWIENETVKNNLLKDSGNIVKLVELGRDNNDVEALFLAHRITEDLDYWLFDMRHRQVEKYGVTHTLDNSNIADDFLEKRQ